MSKPLLHPVIFLLPDLQFIKKGKENIIPIIKRGSISRIAERDGNRSTSAATRAFGTEITNLGPHMPPSRANPAHALNLSKEAKVISLG